MPIHWPALSIASLVVASLAAASCGRHAPSSRALAKSAPADSVQHLPAADGRVVLVTLDGARWEDVFDVAIMPHAHELVAKSGVAYGGDGHRGTSCGIVRTATGINVSLPGYLEIFTGRPTHCADNGCRAVAEPTLLDVAASTLPGSVASIGSWDVLERAVSNGTSRAIVAVGRRNWPSGRLAAGGRLGELVRDSMHANPLPGAGAYRPDAYTSAIALEYFRLATPVLLHVGLGDMDEWAHHGDRAAYLGALRNADAFLGELAETVDAMGAIGARTTVIVTADHGRSSDFRHHGQSQPESGRVFVLAFGARVERRGVACATREMTLADIAPTVRVLLGLDPDPSAEAGVPIDGIVSRTLRHFADGRPSPLEGAGGVQRP